MKLSCSILLLTALLASAAPAAAQDQTLLGFTGYDYQTDPGSPNGIYLALGDSYYAVGFATYFHPVWLEPYVDTGVNEYTFYQRDLVVDSYSFGSGVLVVTFAPGGVVEYFEDPSFDATNPPNPPNCPAYGSNPPNGDAPGKFNNGTLAIRGSLVDASLYYDYNSDQGGFQSEMNITVDAFGYVPVGSYNGWFMTGLVTPPLGGNPCSAPTGYDHQLSGSCTHPVTSTTRGTWGSIKKLYR